MAELTWQDNSKAMFDKMIESSPKPFRAMTEKKLMEAIVAKAGDGDGDGSYPYRVRAGRYAKAFCRHGHEAARADENGKVIF